MKFTDLFGIILASSALALFSPHRCLRTVTAAVSGGCGQDAQAGSNSGSASTQ
ncbi:MAG TPA: hypothetical protein PKV17_04800 [Aquabacterium sp.]|nr:hypothetical protein [Aquabacterium sp.]HRH28081.1 hypothetical protein [Aquabacterium sp.]